MFKKDSNKLICGVGINDVDYPIRINGTRIKSYDVWRNMLSRCYNKKYQEKQSSYIGCDVCEEWKYFSNFKKWFDVHYIKGFALDKDILIQGNKIYSPLTCLFIPQYINNLLIKCDATRGNYPIGVDFNKYHNKFRAKCKNGNSSIFLGYYNSSCEAHEAYKIYKYQYIKDVATSAYLKGDINLKICEILLNYKIEKY